jgi:peptide/nickel transport system permease protein
MSRRPLDLVLPGAALSLRDRVRGLPTLGVWIGLLALALTRRDRIVATLTGGGVDDWLALATLLTGLVIAWRLGQVGDIGAHDVGADTHPETETQWSLAWRAFRRHRPAMMGLVLVVLLAGAALLTPYLAPFDPAAQGTDIVATRFQGPTLEHLMGTDRFGRDVLSRVLYGGRISLAIGFLAVVIAITLGTMVGAVAGYIRGWVDSISMRIVDMLLSFPRLVLLITVVALIEPSILIITIVLGLTGWMGTSRVVRGEVLSVREREFVVAARALGFGRSRILLRHILPNVVSPIIVAATLGIGNTILAEAALSFLGLGVPPPAPSWGGMVAAGRDVMLDAWWITLFPGLAIVFTVMAFNLIGDGLRDALDPRTIVGTDS